VAPRGDQGVVLRINGSLGPFTLRVGRVVQLAAIVGSEDAAEGDGTGNRPAGVVGTWRWHEQTVFLLDGDALGVDEAMPVDVPEGEGGVVGQVAITQDLAAEALLEPVVVVEVAGEQYALPIDAVREVVAEAERTPVPRAPDEVMGVALLRGEPLLLLSFARLLGRADAGATAFVVVTFADFRVGLIVDRLVGIRRFRAKNQHTVLDGYQGLDGYYVAEDDSVVGAVDLERLIDARLLTAFKNFAPVNGNGGAEDAVVEQRQFLTFDAGGELCALAIDAIDRVLAYAEPVRLPNGGSEAVHGALEIQGHVVPVAEVQRRLATGGAAVDPGAYVVVRLADGPCALAVDRVHRIVQIPVGAIEQIGSGQDMIAEIGRLGDRLFWILAPDRLAGVAA
jgi:purine-binding chemotaxis protein CheW